MTQVVIKNTRGIRYLDFDMPDGDGGVLVARGKNAVGKSTAIALLRGLLAGKIDKTRPSDGEKRGTVDGFGVHASVGARTVVSGEANVPSLEGKFDFSDLVRPMAKTIEARDKIRIKALIGLSGAKADPSLFYSVAGGKKELEALVPPEALTADDPIELADKVRRAIHAKARDFEDDAARQEGYAKSLRDAAGEFAGKEAPDMDRLHSAAHEATAALAKLSERFAAADLAEKRQAQAKEELSKAKMGYSGTSVEMATEGLKLASDSVAASNSALEVLKAQLRELEDKISDAESEIAQRAAEVRKYEERLKEAKAHVKTVESLEAIIDSVSTVEAPDELDLEMAEQAVRSTRAAIEDASAASKAAEKLKNAEEHQAQATAARDRAATLRESAKAVDDCLTEALPAGPLKAKDGQLVCDTDRGSDILFDECSDGERWGIALPYGIRSVGAGGVIAVVQDAWQDLDDERRDEVDRLCREAKVWIVTAEVAAGELRVERYQA